MLRNTLLIPHKEMLTFKYSHESRNFCWSIGQSSMIITTLSMKHISVWSQLQYYRAGESSYRLVRTILYNTATNNHCAFTLVIIVLYSIKDSIYKVTGQKFEEFTMREHQRNKPKYLRRSSLAVVNSLRIAIWFPVSVKCLWMCNSITLFSLDWVIVERHCRSTSFWYSISGWHKKNKLDQLCNFR